MDRPIVTGEAGSIARLRAEKSGHLKMTDVAFCGEHGGRRARLLASSLSNATPQSRARNQATATQTTTGCAASTSHAASDAKAIDARAAAPPRRSAPAAGSLLAIRRARACEVPQKPCALDRGWIVSGAERRDLEGKGASR